MRHIIEQCLGLNHYVKQGVCLSASHATGADSSEAYTGRTGQSASSAVSYACAQGKKDEGRLVKRIKKGEPFYWFAFSSFIKNSYLP